MQTTVKEVSVEELKEQGFFPMGYTLIIECQRKGNVTIRSFYLKQSKIWNQIERSLYMEGIVSSMITSVQLVPPHNSVPSYCILKRLEAQAI